MGEMGMKHLVLDLEAEEESLSTTQKKVDILEA
jgi:hypothetical protein